VEIIFLLYPETKGRPLEDMDSLFGKAPSAQAAHEELEEESALAGDASRPAAVPRKIV